MTHTIETVKKYLDNYGWQYECISEDALISGFKGDDSTFTLFVKADDDWIVLSVLPFDNPSRSDCFSNVTAYLSRLNFHSTLVKFSIDDEDNILCTVELPVIGMMYESFIFSLETLCFYVEDQHPIISDLATNQDAKLPSL
jgi:hypothetical protein